MSLTRLHGNEVNLREKKTSPCDVQFLHGMYVCVKCKVCVCVHLHLCLFTFVFVSLEMIKLCWGVPK